MARKQVLLSRVFTIESHQLTFTAVVRAGCVLVEFDVSTHSEAAPLLTLEKPWRDRQSACYYVENITVKAANKLLEYYRTQFADFVGLVDDAFSRKETSITCSRSKLFEGR